MNVFPSAPGRKVDYANWNYCSHCENARIPKEILRCPNCHYPVRTVPKNGLYKERLRQAMNRRPEGS